jgi:hypothetical protein
LTLATCEGPVSGSVMTGFGSARYFPRGVRQKSPAVLPADGLVSTGRADGCRDIWPIDSWPR